MGLHKIFEDKQTDWSWRWVEAGEFSQALMVDPELLARESPEGYISERLDRIEMQLRRAVRESGYFQSPQVTRERITSQNDWEGQPGDTYMVRATHGNYMAFATSCRHPLPEWELTHWVTREFFGPWSLPEGDTVPRRTIGCTCSLCAYAIGVQQVREIPDPPPTGLFIPEPPVPIDIEWCEVNATSHEITIATQTE